MINIKINNNFHKYNIYEDSYIIGYAFVKDILLKEDSLLNAICESIKQNDLDSFLLSLNGSFSAILNYDGITYVISDKVRSYQLLYQKQKDDIVISDTIFNLEIDKKRVSLENEMEFLSCGYLSFDKTLLNDIFHVAAGTYILIKNDEIEKNEYHSYVSNEYLDDLENNLFFVESKKKIESAFRRCLKSIGDKQIVIPLSGGYDSRLLACLCKEFNLPNVVCYTYGRKDSFEVEISQKVAKKLGFKWFFIEYTETKVMNLISNRRFLYYLDNVTNYTAIAHFQDFLAIQEMYDLELIEKNAVIIPGHSGDLLGGSKIPKILSVFNNTKLIDSIYDCFFDLCKKKYNKRNINIKHIKYQLTNYLPHNMNEFLNYYECVWFNKSKIPNFIVNSMRVYELFGYEWRLPLWDDEYVSFWYKVDWIKKKDSTLYNDFMFKVYFDKYGVSFPKIFAKQKIDPKIKRLIPRCFLSYIRNLYIRVNSIKYDFNSQSIQIEMIRKLGCIENSKYDLKIEDDINSVLSLYVLNNLYK